MYETITTSHTSIAVAHEGKPIWHIRYSLPKGANSAMGVDWRMNGSLTLCADNLEEALKMAREKEPQACFWQINHGGNLHGIAK